MSNQMDIFLLKYGLDVKTKISFCEFLFNHVEWQSQTYTLHLSSNTGSIAQNET